MAAGSFFLNGNNGSIGQTYGDITVIAQPSGIYANLFGAIGFFKPDPVGFHFDVIMIAAGNRNCPRLLYSIQIYPFYYLAILLDYRYDMVAGQAAEKQQASQGHEHQKEDKQYVISFHPRPRFPLLIWQKETAFLTVSLYF